MKKTGKPSGISVICSDIILIVTALALEALHGMTRYLPFCLLAMICLLPSLINLITILFRAELPIKIKDKDSEVFEENAADTPENTAPPTDGVAAEDESKQSKQGFLAKPGKQNRQGSKKKRKKSFKLKSFSARVKRALHSLALFYNAHRVTLAVICAAVAVIISGLRFFLMFSRMTSVYQLSYPVLIGLTLAFIILIALDKWCAHTEGRDLFAKATVKNVRSHLVLIRISLLLVIVGAALRLLGFYDAQWLLRYILLVIFCYLTVFTVITFSAAVIKKELFTAPGLNIPTPFSIGGGRDFGILTYLEENTGITMRSLWSIRMMKKIVPYTVLAAALIFWISTGLVQVESYQTGIVYRFGQLSRQTLEPGLHMTLPWPFDKPEVYDTDSVKKLTIGYISSDDTDNTWTGAHGSNEYKLLLGSGDELVSINLRIEYKIEELYDYLKSSAAPESILEAQTYELITSRTIDTDLETLLSVDRSAFAENFLRELSSNIENYSTGLSIVSVVLESIHPPIEVAEVYQNIISAEIEAEKYILDAQAYAATAIAGAEASRDTSISEANADNFTKLAAARADVAEFMASVEADGIYPVSYRYYKYLTAVGTAYGNAKLVIVGDGIDSSNIYFGNLYPYPAQ